MMTDPISDMLTRIRNAQMVKKAEVVLPYSKLKLNILKLLEEEGWLKKVEIKEPSIAGVTKKIGKEKIAKFKELKADIVYDNQGKPKIKSLKRVSSPGKRIYVTKENLPKVLNGWGMAVISTSKGILTDKQARKQGLGGEVICEIY